MSNPSRSRSTGSRTARRREEIRRTMPRPSFDLRGLIERPDFVNGAVVIVGFLVAVSFLTVWSRAQLKVEVGQVMTTTRLKRLDYRVPDLKLTETRRAEARNNAPHVYTLNGSYLDRLAASLNGLPIAVAGKTNLDEISKELRDEFKLTEPGLRALAPFAVEGQTTQEWQQWVANLVNKQLVARPLIESSQYQTYWVGRQYSANLKRLLSRPGAEAQEIPRDAEGIELLPEQAEFPGRIQQSVHAAGFPPEVVPYITARIAQSPQPTISIAKEPTDGFAAKAAEAVATEYVEHREGEPIYKRGDRLSGKQYEELETESLEFFARAPFSERWLPRVAIVGLTVIVAVFTVGYVLLFYPRIARNTTRLFAVCALAPAMLGITVMVGARSPSLMYIGAVAPTIFVAIVVLLAYDQRIALFMSAIQAALATFALEKGVAVYLVLFAGCGVAVAQLRDMRNRNTLIQASGITAGVLAVATLLVGLLETPMVSGAARQILLNGFWAGLSGFAVGFVVLGMLPTLERWFDITTGMTLAELRDPKQPLLRQLQQRAPGTYNHSLQVANIAEAAAEAIGANGLLVYVGALYHDIGKMNKPEYFVENQTQGPNKHDKLSPAMSLLVIIGHIKDGMELAREYGLPRSIQHFIDTHHGTTLVEYFYHAARARREGEQVAEIEFRYPGPKPRTKEAAILMLADAVESAARTLSDPNPSRIEGLVRNLSRKRLTDGQYDQCDLSFRELTMVEESVVKSLCAIYHGRIAYPSQREEEKKPAATMSA